MQARNSSNHTARPRLGEIKGVSKRGEKDQREKRQVESLLVYYHGPLYHKSGILEGAFPPLNLDC